VTTGYVSQLATSTALTNQIAADGMTLSLNGTTAAIGIAVFLLAVGFAWSRIRRKGVGAKKF